MKLGASPDIDSLLFTFHKLPGGALSILDLLEYQNVVNKLVNPDSDGLNEEMSFWYRDSTAIARIYEVHILSCLRDVALGGVATCMITITLRFLRSLAIRILALKIPYSLIYKILITILTTPDSLVHNSNRIRGHQEIYLGSLVWYTKLIRRPSKNIESEFFVEEDTLIVVRWILSNFQSFHQKN